MGQRTKIPDQNIYSKIHCSITPFITPVSRLLVSIVTFLIFVMLWSKNPAYAQEIGLKINPPLVQAIIKPDTSITINYTLVNTGDPATVTLSMHTFKQTSPDGTMMLQPKTDDTITFIIADQNFAFGKPLLMEHNSELTIPVRINTSSSTPNQDYYFTLLARTKNPSGRDGETNTLVSVEIGSNLLLTVSQTANLEIKGKIAQFDVKPRFRLSLSGKTYNIIDSLDPVRILLVVSNDGKNRFVPSGSITLVGNFGEVARYPLAQQSVLAHTSRKILTDADKQPDLPDLYSLVLAGLFVGKYQLSTDVTLSQGAGTMFATTSFYAVPFKLILLLTIMVLLAIYIYLKLKN